MTRRRLAAGVLAALLCVASSEALAQQRSLASLTREGSALMAEGRLEEALQRFRAATELRPGDPALEFNVGLTLFQMGKFAEALPSLERATKHPPSALQAHFLRGTVYFEGGNFEAATPALEAARNHERLGEQSLYMLVEIYRLEGAAERSQERFLELQRRFPESAYYHKLMGAAYDAEGLFPQAASEFQAALRKEPGMPEVAYAIGLMEYKQHNHAGAMDWFGRELSVQPCFAKAHFYLGEIAAAGGNAADAEARYRRSIACDAQYAAGHAGLGALLLKSRRYEQALEMLLRAVALDPESADAQYSLGQVLLRLGRKEESQAAFRKVDQIHAAKHATAKRALGNSGQGR